MSLELATWRLAGPLRTRKRAVQAGDPVRLQAVVAPVVESGAEPRAPLGVELDRPARPDLETLAYRLRPQSEGKVLEQGVALAPRDLHDLASDVDAHATWAVGFHRGRAYPGGAA